ncbi:MAG: penicillin-binding transpeptidase domain-containing protein [Verrucomicrobiae bacterium]|nr:penicillin-binding transpeptidase domain-containing protein [Verrucomicrobiae bacterium]
MPIFDQLRKADPQLRLLGMLMLFGLGILMIGLWWIQIVSADEYRAKVQTQSFRTVRIPPVRGKILDRNRLVLADNRPAYNINLYLEELRDAFQAAYKAEVQSFRERLRTNSCQDATNTAVRTTRLKLSASERAMLRKRARAVVVTNIVTQLSARLELAVGWDPAGFERHYTQALPLPFTLVTGLDQARLARFEEQLVTVPGLELEVTPMRVYPYGSLAAHLLGHVRRDTGSAEGEEAFLDYPLPVYRGVVGIEGGFDQYLRGRAGAKSVMVNSLGYRQAETVWSEAVPGANVVLTIDLAVQQAAENALARLGPHTRGAVVVLDPRDGDVLALVSSPTYDPNIFVRGLSQADWAWLSDPKLRPQINRATQAAYPPGSIFKLITALACLETGLDPSAKIYNPPAPANPARGHIQVGRRIIHDTAPPGEYDFRRGLLKSSNTYFITNGLKAGIHAIIGLARRFYLGEKTGFPTRQEVGGTLPSLRRISTHWYDGDTANICIGQGPVSVTPLQMAVMTAAIANGGKVYWPRIVARVDPQPGQPGASELVYPRGRLRGELGVNPRYIALLREAMLAGVEDPESTAYAAFHQHDRPRLSRFRVCGKTGTAQVMDEQNRVIDHITWFVSFAPYEQPRYVVVVMVESGGSGGTTCAPVACEIYRALERLESEALLASDVTSR